MLRLTQSLISMVDVTVDMEATGIEEAMAEGTETKEEEVAVEAATGAIGVILERETAVAPDLAVNPVAGRTGGPAGPDPGPRRRRWTGWRCNDRSKPNTSFFPLKL